MREVSVLDSTRNGAVVGSRIQVAGSPLARLIGLMARKFLEPGTGLLLRPCSSVHICWPRPLINDINLNSHLRVIAINIALKPWRVGSVRLRTRMALELPAGTVARLCIALGDQLAIEDMAPKTATTLCVTGA
jgi:uncharacterized membrane protein (UPF0127 family)